MTAFYAANRNMNAFCASAHCAEASFACAQRANNTIIAILDAIFVASILICTLLGLVSLLGLVILAVLLVVLVYSHLPRKRANA